MKWSKVNKLLNPSFDFDAAVADAINMNGFTMKLVRNPSTNLYSKCKTFTFCIFHVTRKLLSRKFSIVLLG